MERTANLVTLEPISVIMPARQIVHFDSGVDCQQRTGGIVGGIGGQMHAAGGEIVVRGQLPRHG
jgi:hypothetical protein